MKKYWRIAIIALAFIAIALFYVCGQRNECCLCNSMPHHAPALVNLSTGEILELAVYDADPFHPGELAEEQQTGTFSFIRGAGTSGYRDSGKYVKITIPAINTRMGMGYFCKECRKRLKDYRGYALVDLQNPADPSIYPIMEGVFDIKCYEIDVRVSDTQYEITVTGLRN